MVSLRSEEQPLFFFTPLCFRDAFATFSASLMDFTSPQNLLVATSGEHLDFAAYVEGGMKNPQRTAVEKQFVTTFPEAIGSNPLKLYLPYAWKAPGTTESHTWMALRKRKSSKNRSIWPPSSCTWGGHF